MVEVVKERIGLQRTADGFSLFEVFGQLERNMLPGEKVADAMFKWEKYARSTHSPKILKLTFKVDTPTNIPSKKWPHINVFIFPETFVPEALLQPE